MRELIGLLLFLGNLACFAATDAHIKESLTAEV